MAFGDKLTAFRAASGLSRRELADAAGVSRQTVYNYESDKRYCRDMSIIRRFANALGVTINDLIGEEDYLILEAEAKGGNAARRDIQVLVSRVTAMFAGGELDDEDRDAALRAITDAYWDAKTQAAAD